MGASGAELPGGESMPMWLQLLIAAMGPTAALMFATSTRAVRKAFAAYLQARGQAMLDDKDRSNDATGKGLLAGAAALDKEKGDE